MLPGWLNAETLPWVILAVLILLVYGMYLVARFVRRAIMKFVLFVVLVGLGFSLWLQRSSLQDCIDTCACSLYGQEVEIPEERRPDRC